MTEQAVEQVPAYVSEIIQKAVRCLLEATDPIKVVLFGSFARGDNTEGRDLDFLVILPVVTNRQDEMVGLSRALAPLCMPIDILVYTVQEVEERATSREQPSARP